MPNILSIVRLLGTVPLIILIYNNGINTQNIILFILLCITDFLDGYIARKYNKITNFGKIIDGISDKFLMLGITIILLIKHIIPLYSLLIFIRDIVSCIYAFYYIKYKNIVLKSNIYGKLKTILHIITIILVLFFKKWTILSDITFVLAILTTLLEIRYILKKK